MKAFSLLILSLALTVTFARSALADESVEIPTYRLNVFLVPKAGEREFVVAQSDEEFSKMLQRYAPSVQLYKQRPPPVVNFGERVVVAYVWEDFPCQPYRVGRVLEYPDRVTVEIIHKVRGDNCICSASSMAAAAAVTIPRINKPIGYIIKPEEGPACTKPSVP
jgi:hypothetical protein